MLKTVRTPFVAAALVVPVLVGCQPTASVVAPTAVAPTPSSSAVGTPTAAPPSPTAAPTPTASPTATPSPIPTPSPSPVTLGVSARGVALAAGTYRAADPFTVPFTITLPAGYETNSFSTGEVSVANGAGGYGLTLDLIQNVFVDPCHTQGPMPSPAPTTVGELVPLLTHMVGFTAGPVADDIIGGHPAKSFKLTNTVDTATAACTGGPLLPLWTFRGGPATGAATNGGVSLLIWVTDVGGTPLIIASDSDATNLDAKRAEIGAVVHSIQFDD